MEPISISQGRFAAPLLRLQSDDRLARLAASGGDPAFEELVRRYRPQLLRACSRILPGDRAEDAAQQALLNAHQALRRNGTPDRFAPWLHRIAVNEALKEVKRAPTELPLNEEGIDGVEQPPEHLERRERLRGTVAAIGALPEGQRRALIARELEGRSHGEIARELGLSAGAVRQLIHRGRSAVRAAATAVTPWPLLARLTATEAPAHTAEVVGGGIAGAAGAKAIATVLVAGGIAGGVALAPDDGSRSATAAPEPSQGTVLPSGLPDGLLGFGDDDDSGEGSSGRGRGRGRGGDEDGSGRGRGRGGDGISGGDEPDGDASGSDSSGSGSSGSLSSGSSGPGSSGSGSSGSGSPEDSSVSDSSGSGSSGDSDFELDDD